MIYEVSSVENLFLLGMVVSKMCILKKFYGYFYSKLILW